MLELIGLEKRYRDVVALSGMSWRAVRGRMLGFLGPNGAGKTTSMRAVFGLVDLDGGEVRWDEQPIGPGQWARFGYMPEQRGLYPRMAVGEQVSYFGELHGMERADARRAAEDLLGQLGLADRSGDRLRDLSHGNQQRVQLAAALVHDPECLVLDEPFSGLDPIGVDAMSATLRERAEHGCAVVFSSHQLDLVESLCDDVAVVHRGRSVLAGPLASVRREVAERRVEIELASHERWDLPDGARDVEWRGGRARFTVASTADVSTYIDAARRNGEVVHFEFAAPSLSEIFRMAVDEPGEGA
ncbi:MAG: ATP-binding cassette domain-containing protein [Actinomycetota bacterium]|nr:ATP-binding cassette domain-containing protein [Actinomycetota bacterium]